MSLRILVFEHEPIMAIDLEAALQDAGHTVFPVVNSTDRALAVAREGSIDLAIVDLLLSRRCNGVETARRLYVEHGVRSLFVSVHSSRRDDALQQTWNPVGFVMKPYGEHEITRHLTQLG